MVYYKLGYEALKGYAAEGGRQWAEFGNSRPVLRKLVIFTAAIFFLVVLFGGVAPAYAPDYVSNVPSANDIWSSAANKVSSFGT